MIDAAALPLWLTALSALALTVVAVATARAVSVKTGWEPAGALVILALSPLAPHVPVSMGLSLDDVPPVVGTALLLRCIVQDRRDLRSAWRCLPRAVRGIAMIAGEAIVLVVIAAAVSSVANAAGPVDAFRLFARSGIRYLLLSSIVVLAAMTDPPEWRTSIVARTLAVVGTAEATFGVLAYVLPLPGRLGLELTRRSSVLFDTVPGRVAGTIGLSPDFLGALFLFTIPFTVVVALETQGRNSRSIAWAAVIVQGLALGLTFARASLALVLLEVAVLVLWRGSKRYLVPLAASLVPVALLTPAVERLAADVPDRLALWTSGFRMMIDHPLVGVGSGNMVAVELAQPDRYLHTVFGAAQVNAHNTIILAGAELGVLGFAGLLLLNLSLALLAGRMLWLAIRGKRRLASAAAALAVLSFLVQGMVNDLFTVAVVGVVAAMVVGSTLVREEREGAQSEIWFGT